MVMEKRKLTAKEKYDLLPDKYKTFSIRKALKGIPLTQTEIEKVKRQVRELKPDQPESFDDFWNRMEKEYGT